MGATGAVRARRMSGSDGSDDVVVFYPAGKDIAGWARDYGAGARPDEWPYGLNKLAHHVSSVKARNLPRDTALQGGLRRLMRATPPTLWRGRGPVGLVWDENSVDRLAAVPALRSRFSGVVWLTDQLARKEPSWLAERRSMLRRMDGLWVLSSAQVGPLQHFIGEDGPRVHHVVFGVDADFFHAAPPPETPLLVSVGGDRDRDAATLFRALARVRHERPDVEIVIQTTSREEPPAGVTLVPHLSHGELRQLYQRASVCVIATRPNTHVSGMTVGLESMATGRPLVITETPGMADYFGGTDGAQMVAPSDADALAAAALRLLNDPTQRQRRGQAARAHVEGGFTTDHLGARVAAIVSV